MEVCLWLEVSSASHAFWPNATGQRELPGFSTVFWCKTDGCPVDWMVFQDCFFWKRMLVQLPQFAVTWSFWRHFRIDKFKTSKTLRLPRSNWCLFFNHSQRRNRWGFPSGLAQQVDGWQVPARCLCVAGPGWWSALPGRHLSGDPFAVSRRAHGCKAAWASMGIYEKNIWSAAKHEVITCYIHVIHDVITCYIHVITKMKGVAIDFGCWFRRCLFFHL